MATLREWIRRLWGSLRPGRDLDLENELRLHQELAREEWLARGGTPRDAQLAVGTIARTMDAVRDQRGVPWLDDLTRDLRHSARALRRHPGFTTVALITLAIGIGANSAVFSVVNSVLIKPLPYPDADRLVAVRHVAPGAPGLATVSGELRLSGSMFFTYAEQNRMFEHIGIWFVGTGTVTGVAQPEQVRLIGVSNGTLEALGTPPVLGRWLSSADQRPGASGIILGYGYWQRRFGGDRAVVGRSITLDSRPREIVGVMPQDFRLVTSDADVIVPVGLDRSRQILPGFGFQAVARLKPGVTIGDASADVARMIPIWNQSWPAFPGVNPRIYESWRLAPSLRPLKDDVVGPIQRALWVLMGTMGIVLLIACANVANLLLVRAEARQSELAVRAALGAGTGRIVRALLLESVTLALAGGALGLAFAYGGLRALVTMGPATLPRLHEIGLDPPGLAFTFAISLGSGLLFGSLPAAKYAGGRLAFALHGGGRTSSDSRGRLRARSALVVAQVALALVLLVSAGLMIRTSLAMRGVRPGFADPEQLQILRLPIPVAVAPDAASVTRLQHDIVDRLAEIPGVASVGFASALPMEGIPPDWDGIVVEQKTYSASELPPFRLFKTVSPGFFRTTGTRLVAGREYTWDEMNGGRELAIVSENLARELWGSATAAIGKRIRRGAPSEQITPWQEVVGVVQDVREYGVDQPAPPTVYWLATRSVIFAATGRPGLGATRTASLAIRSPRAGTEALLTDMQRAVWSVNADLPVGSIGTMADVYEHSMARTSFTLVMLAIASVMALVLGIVGIYGVMSYTVSQRAREIGIRLALGASRARLQQMFVRRGLEMAGGGVAIGLIAAAFSSRLMSSLLFGVSPYDPATFGGVAAVLALTALLASYLPARRAARVNPAETLKAD
jgi:predicted permease